MPRWPRCPELSGRRHAVACVGVASLQFGLRADKVCWSDLTLCLSTCYPPPKPPDKNSDSNYSRDTKADTKTDFGPTDSSDVGGLGPSVFVGVVLVLAVRGDDVVDVVTGSRSSAFHRIWMGYAMTLTLYVTPPRVYLNEDMSSVPRVL